MSYGECGCRHANSGQPAEAVIYTQAMGTEDTTAQVHPAKLTAAFVSAAERQAGSRVRIGTVTGVRLGGSPGQQHVEGGRGNMVTWRSQSQAQHSAQFGCPDCAADCAAEAVPARTSKATSR